MAKSSERLEAAKPKPEEASRVSHLVSALSMVVTLVAAAYAAELHLKVGLYLFAEQALALILGLCLAIIFLIVVVWGTNILIRKFNKVSMESNPVVLNPKQNETGGIPAKNLSVSGPATQGKAISLKETDILSNTSAVVSKKPSENHSGKPILSVENSPATVENEDTLEELKINSNTTPDISNNGNEGGVPTLFAKNDMPLKLNIKGIDNVWFDIMVDDSHVEDFILPKGAEKIFYAKDYYLLNVGDRNAVDLKLNNTTLDLPKGVEGNIVRNFRINSRLID